MSVLLAGLVKVNALGLQRQEHLRQLGALLTRSGSDGEGAGASWKWKSEGRCSEEPHESVQNMGDVESVTLRWEMSIRYTSPYFDPVVPLVVVSAADRRSRRRVMDWSWIALFGQCRAESDACLIHSPTALFLARLKNQRYSPSLFQAAPAAQAYSTGPT